MDWKIGDLPLHPLFVHLTTIAVPTAALLALAIAVWPAARRRLGVAAPLIVLVALISTPLASSSGESLQEQEPRTAAIEHHAELGDTLLPWVIALFALTVAWWALHHIVLRPHRERSARIEDAEGSRRVSTDRRAADHAAAGSPGLARIAGIVLPILLVIAGTGALVDVILIGHAGAVAVWAA